ncbi:transformer-2 protein [Cryptococcus neoformans C23]|uniref:Transformer-2-beta isoform 3 n=1 Tax=Cryptococcus neoformans (strain H99 / ATCC 208821 / CBS 10515 / FGSC 9487) TaxID=235443 RepID=J9VE09_CRYN9|nr:transformer-2-beta isoform 3 [Cryptococcus neoformans var. grubii H99]AFR92532.2 transformer-2-beta isoform 3 [Cryptococcus neoformans var. grubii H99]AUB21974.1 transformer-2-beta isoform 3 [Cryptococcus neoformans var. grubii]OWZ47986.1 transformer-2 protein [Cryptococcus neoformans var. grubii C23]|eukprot:XP_012046295.1 transformer-2-beta isoform 3 [Cryptococcus neoformans var. grubii H99]
MAFSAAYVPSSPGPGEYNPPYPGYIIYSSTACLPFPQGSSVFNWERDFEKCIYENDAKSSKRDELMTFDSYAVRSPSPSDSRSRDAIPTKSPPKSSLVFSEVKPTNILGVFGLSVRTTERDLQDEFSRHGKIEKIVIVYDQRTGRSRGFAFITMRSIEDATQCIDRLNGLTIHGRNIRVDYSATPKPHDPTPGQYLGPKRTIISDERLLSRDGRYDDCLEMDGSLHHASHCHHFNRNKDRYDIRDDQMLNRLRRLEDAYYRGRHDRRDNEYRHRRISLSPRRNTYETSPNRRGRDAAYESGCSDFSRYL